MPKPDVKSLCRLPLALMLGLALVGCKSTVAPSGDCKPVAVNKGADGLSLMVSDKVVKSMGPEYFGFNLENSEFQLSLWDAERQQVRPEVTRFLKQHFPGAVYRYPGGTTANYHRWKTSVGKVATRKSVRINDWIELPRIEFGVDEYLDFVGEIDGQVWYVLNLKGDIDRLADIDKLSGEAADLVQHIGERKVPVVRWELGNELDRFEEKWTSDLYVNRAQTVMAAVRKVDPKARFVAMMADFDAQSDRGINASQYNTALAKGLKDSGITEFAQHLYYDGEPDGPPVTNRIDHLCQSIADAEKGGVPAKDVGFWVTEHARWPEGQGEAWNRNWRQSGDLGASIGLADLIITTTQLPQVKGTDLHALHGSTGPWPMFHQPEGLRLPSVGAAACLCAAARDAAAPGAGNEDQQRQPVQLRWGLFGARHGHDQPGPQPLQRLGRQPRQGGHRDHPQHAGTGRQDAEGQSGQHRWRRHPDQQLRPSDHRRAQAAEHPALLRCPGRGALHRCPQLGVGAQLRRNDTLSASLILLSVRTGNRSHVGTRRSQPL